MRENVQYNKTVRGRAGSIAGSVAKYFLLILFAAIIILPLLWVLMSAFKTTTEISASPFSFPKTLSFENFVNAWNKASMGAYFLNSILITGGGLVLLLVWAFGGNTKIGKRNWARAMLIFSAVAVAFYILVFIIALVGVGTGYYF